eukprot:TRINITY_DN33879_c0_g1_i1.p1 TRINITY_DN33879_c0_g1~~TRINITY_DN33879_c0_g1_i1.p1  ORF type:complete len:1194 (+),score=252.16 TRINITY_DN33879_c0_g1_i1:19-3600(+)
MTNSTKLPPLQVHAPHGITQAAAPHGGAGGLHEHVLNCQSQQATVHVQPTRARRASWCHAGSSDAADGGPGHAPHHGSAPRPAAIKARRMSHHGHHPHQFEIDFHSPVVPAAAQTQPNFHKSPRQPQQQHQHHAGHHPTLPAPSCGSNNLSLTAAQIEPLSPLSPATSQHSHRRVTASLASLGSVSSARRASVHSSFQRHLPEGAELLQSQPQTHLAADHGGPRPPQGNPTNAAGVRRPQPFFRRGSTATCAPSSELGQPTWSASSSAQDVTAAAPNWSTQVSEPTSPDGVPEMPIENFKLDDDSLADALRRALLDRYGTPEGAFRWLDFFGLNRISRSSFISGMKTLHLPPPCGLVKPQRLYSLIDVKKAGTITFAVWKTFFGGEEDGDESCGTGSGSLSAAAAKSFRQLQRLKSLKGCADALNVDTGFTRKTSGDDADQATSWVRSIYADNDSPTKGSLPPLQGIIELMAEETEHDLEGSSHTRKLRRKLTATVIEQAEEEQLKSEITSLSMDGVRALAYILVAKCGSLDAAFQWLDYTNTNKITGSQWQTAVAVLHLDVEQMTGMAPSTIFQNMGGTGGQVNKQQWQRFFAENLQEDDQEVLQNLREGFKERAKQQVQQRLRFKSAVTGIMGLKRASSTRASLSHMASGKSMEFENALGALEPGGAQSPGKEDAGKATGRRNSAWKSSSGTRSFKGDTKLSSPTSATSKENQKGTAAPSGKQEAAPSQSPRSAEASKSDDGTRTPGSPRGPSGTNTSLEDEDEEDEVFEEHGAVEDFERRMAERLDALQPDEGIDFGRLLKTKRGIVQRLCEERGIWHGRAGAKLVVFKEGEQAEQIRLDLLMLPPGQVMRLNGLDEVRRHFIIAVGAEQSLLQVDVPGDDEALEFLNEGENDDDFTGGMRRTLLALAAGDVFVCPSGLGATRRKIVMHIAQELGLLFADADDEDGRSLVVANLANFGTRITEEMRSLEEGSSASYDVESCWEVDLESSEAEAAQLLARHLSGRRPHLARIAEETLKMVGWRAGVKVDTALELEVGKRILQCSRAPPGGAAQDEGVEQSKGAAQDKRKREGRESPKLLFREDDGVEQRLQKVWELYAAGQRGKSEFLRKQDLPQLVQDACTLKKRKLTEDVMVSVELIFDDVLELSLDMGSEHSYGLTKPYFQVFLSKSVSMLGWTMGSLLIELLKWYDS